MRTIDPIASLYDSVLDFASERFMRVGKTVHWKVCLEDVPRGFSVVVVIDGETVVQHNSRSLARTAQEGYRMFEAWRADQPDEIARALEVSVETAQVEKELAR